MGRPRPPRRWRQRSRGAEEVLSCPVLSFPLFVLAVGDGRFLFPFVRRVVGGRRLGMPHYDYASWSKVGKG